MPPNRSTKTGRPGSFALVRVAFVVLLLAPGLGAARPLDIVLDGRPVATVVLAPDAGDQVRAAADLLVSLVEQSTGARLPVADRAPDTGTVIYVGGELDRETLALDPPLDDDGFVIAFPDERSLRIAGPTDWGTEFGVYEFLERYVGVRWLLPGEDGTDVPKSTRISVPKETVRQSPAFFSRQFSGLSGAAQTQWARRNRMRSRVSFHHNLLHLFPPSQYTETHPEFFPLLNGQRYLPKSNDEHRWQPCFTAPGIVDEAVRNIVGYFDTHPRATSYSLGVNDTNNYCACEDCLSRISGEKNFLGYTDYSDLYYAWANDVIEGVLKRHPHKWFGCLAYSLVAAPPSSVEVHPRLIPYLTYDRMKWVVPEIRATGEDLTRAWHERSPVLGWYDYIYGTPYCLPRVWFHQMGAYYRFGHANGVRAAYAEAYPNWGEGPKLYVSLKLQWDPDRDVDQLLEEWFQRCVGAEAAPYLARYYEHWEDFWTRRAPESPWFTQAGQYLTFSSPLYLDDIRLAEIDQSRQWLETAVAKAATEKQRARAQLLLGAFEYYEATAYAFKLGGSPRDGPVETDQQALAVLESAGKAIEYARTRRRLALEEFPQDPVLVHPLPMTRYSLIQNDSTNGGGLWAAYDVATRGDGPVRRRIRQLAQASEDTLARGQARMMLALIENRLEPMNKNASFEQGNTATAEAWSWWVKFGVGRMLRTREVAHEGDFSVLCDGMRRGGPVQQLPIGPGKYGLVCFVYVPEGQSSTGTTELSMTLRDAAGVNLPSSSTRIVPAPGRWTALAVAADVPEKIGAAAVKFVMPMLVVDGFKPGEKVYFDDLMLYRLEE